MVMALLMKCDGELPPGFRFHPTDEELVVHYLKRKAHSAPLPASIIADIDLYKFDPWDLPSKAMFGEEEWYFFSPRERKYPNGRRPNRAATSGYWKATGTDKPIFSSDGNGQVGVKKALVFYGGKPPKGVKTNWIMHEYRLPPTFPHHHLSPNSNSNSKSNSLRLDGWVLCRIYKKTNRLPPTLPFSTQTSMIPAMDYNSKPTSPTTYAPLPLQNHRNFFHGISNMHQDDSSNMKMGNLLHFSNDTGSSSSTTPFFHGDHDLNNNNRSSTTADEENHSFDSMLSQLPQNTTFHPNALLSPACDDTFKQQFQYRLR